VSLVSSGVCQLLTLATETRTICKETKKQKAAARNGKQKHIVD